ncbi:MAG: TonB-dependent receptor [Emcibacter sp.]|nr:TonB-dependent receptor [Emcibacter sp.]
MKPLPFPTLSRALCLSMALSSPALADVQNNQPHDYDHNHEMEELFVTGAAHSKSRFDVLQGNNLIGLDELEQRMEATIGETLSGIPGISSSFFGAGASRPIIRGLGGDRIRILINGIGSIDASGTSPDHSVAADPLTAMRIEVLRGASTLLYGSNAVGGVVNIIDERIPSVIPSETFSGRTRLGFGSVANEYSGGASLTAKVSGTDDKAIILHLGGYFRNSGNFNIPGYAESSVFHAQEVSQEEDGHEEEVFGSVENSDVDNKGGSAGISWIEDGIMLGVSYSVNDSNYGVPGHDHGDQAVRIDLEQKRFDLKGNLEKSFLFFEEARLRFGFADYKHTELEGTEIGTVFTNEGWEGRIEFIQKDIGNIHGSMGLQIRSRNFEAIGDEAFVPPSRTLQWGIFAVEEVSLDPVTLEFGARFDHQSVDNKSLNQKRTFDSLSLSAGAAIHPTSTSLIGLSISRTERAPTAEELFSNGPHLATGAFEKGNSDLTEEKATSIELTLKQETDLLSARLNIFHIWYNDFIYEYFTGLQNGGLNILEFRQRDALFYGAELETTTQIYASKKHRLMINISGDIIRAKFTNNDGNLPRIPANSATVGLEYSAETFDVRGNIRLVSDQTNTATAELMTKGYTEVNMGLNWRPYGEDQDLTLRLQGKNLTNAERRQHTSFLKDLLPLPGRNIKLSLTYGF